MSFRPACRTDKGNVSERTDGDTSTLQAVNPTRRDCANI